jgi:glycosyltransferase involved in cell wall biosynthesis
MVLKSVGLSSGGTMKIYLSGSIFGSYRAQNIIKTLVDNNISYIHFPLSALKVVRSDKKTSLFYSYLITLISMPLRVLMIVPTTHLIVLPMNSSIVMLFEVLIAKIFRKKVVVDYYVGIFDTLVNDRQKVCKGTLRARWALTKDRFLLRVADKVVFLSEAESSYYQSVAQIKVQDDRRYIVPLCVDYRNEFFGLEKARAKSKFNVCWWGTFIPLHGLETLIEAFPYIGTAEIALYIFGNSEEKAIPYRQLVQKLGLESKISIRNDFTFSNGKLAPFLKTECDLAIGNFGSSDKAKTVLLNKLVDALSLGLPCLTMQTKATLELLPAHDSLIFVSPDACSIAKGIVSAYANRTSMRSISKSAGEDTYLKLFSPDIFKMKYLHVLNS